MKKAFFAVLVLALVSVSCAEFARSQVNEPATVTPVVNNRLASLEEEVLVLINEYRRKKKLSPLQMNNAVVDVSRQHSTDMALGKVPFSHDGFQQRAKRLEVQLGTVRSIAENVAYGQNTAREVVEDWIKSPGHKVNIEGNYTQTGIGIATNKKGVLYYTQIFVR